MSRLDPILQAKREWIAAHKSAAERSAPAAGDRAAARTRPAGRRSLRAALEQSPKPRLIAEIKRRTPTIPSLREPFDPKALAATYASCGASAISIVIDEPFFGGTADWIRLVRSTVPLPVLAKDFVLDVCQIDHAAAAGADALLLIADIVPEQTLRQLVEHTTAAGLEALVEVHSEDSLRKALDAGAVMVGINNRDLTTFQVDTSTALSLSAKVPRHVRIVGESGISRRQDIERLRHAGIDGVLIGEALLTSKDIAAKIGELFGAVYGPGETKGAGTTRGAAHGQN